MGSKELTRAYYHRNKERINEERRKRYRTDPLYREQTRLRWKKFWDRRKDDLLINKRAYENRRRKNKYLVDPLYRKKERDRCKIYNALKRAKIRVENLGNLCGICGKTNMEAKLTIDHIIPASKGGTNELRNLQVLCLRCNILKRDSMPE